LILPAIVHSIYFTMDNRSAQHKKSGRKAADTQKKLAAALKRNLLRRKQASVKKK